MWISCSSPNFRMLKTLQKSAEEGAGNKIANIFICRKTNHLAILLKIVDENGVIFVYNREMSGFLSNKSEVDADS